MHRKIVFVFASIWAVSSLVGCGASQPEHVVKPYKEKPPTNVPVFNTPEDKIKYIQNSKAPDSVKKAAIDKIRAGG